jgi:hypothetical protein
MFRALLAHPQEVLVKRHLVYCVRVMSVGCIMLFSLYWYTMMHGQQNIKYVHTLACVPLSVLLGFHRFFLSFFSPPPPPPPRFTVTENFGLPFVFFF